jgi:hypothetical protein
MRATTTMQKSAAFPLMPLLVTAITTALSVLVVLSSVKGGSHGEACCALAVPHFDVRDPSW